MFSGKVILITGASSGIGASTAIHFAKEKAILSITGRNKENLDKTAEMCEAVSSNKPLTIIGDVTRHEDLVKIMDTTIKTFNRLDVLINNAGMVKFGGILNHTPEELDEIYQTNLKSVFTLSQLALPHLIKSKGNIVNVSSVGGVTPVPRACGYSMMKAALDQFTRCAALDLSSQQVRVNSVNPGTIDTNIFRAAGVPEEKYLATLELCRNKIPMRKYGCSKDVAKAIIFLAGDDANFITGETLCIDGGSQFSVGYDDYTKNL